MSPNPSYVDVLIVGAGPAGLMCANALVRAGINVRIIDKRYAPFYGLDDIFTQVPPSCVGQSRLLLARQTASSHELSKCCRQVQHSLTPTLRNLSCSRSMPRASIQSYGLADRLLSQAAIMVMAVSRNTHCVFGSFVPCPYA
jgi:choline dehydrogenase-like flavoprotein